MLKKITPLLLFVLCCAFGAKSTPAHAGVAAPLTYTVTKTADTNDGTCDADCSLREAISAANADGVDSTVEFDATVFATKKTINLASQLFLGNNGTLTINAPAVGVVVAGKFGIRVISTEITRPLAKVIYVD